MNSDARGGIDRRAAMGAIGAVGAAGLASVAAGQAGTGQPVPGTRVSMFYAGSDLGWDAAKGEYVLPALPYAPDALEPHIDAQTMQIHHGKHHAAYVAGLNKALAELAKIRDGSGEAGLIKHWSRELAFHGGGHINHAIFWRMMAPPSEGGGGRPNGALAKAIDRDFGSFDKFSAHFTGAANAVEGSGWAWLVFEPVSGRLMVQQMEKQQDMLLTGCVPLVGVDVWEHAYYLKYQNRRADYTKAFMNVVNWVRAGEVFEGVSS